MSIDSSIVPVMTVTPPDGKLLYVNPYTDELSEIDVPPTSNCSVDIGKCSELVYDGSRLVWDGVYDLPRYNIKGGILYKDDIITTQETENSIDTSTEPSELKNINVNIRKIKPDINSELKRV